jgi:GTPase SAR1 family protein
MRKSLLKQDILSQADNLIPCEFEFDGVKVLLLIGDRGSGKTLFFEKCIVNSKNINSTSELYFQKRPQRPQQGVYPFSEVPHLRGVKNNTTILIDEIFMLDSSLEEDIFALCKYKHIMLVGTTSIYPASNSPLYKTLEKQFPEVFY